MKLSPGCQVNKLINKYVVDVCVRNVNKEREGEKEGKQERGRGRVAHGSHTQIAKDLKHSMRYAQCFYSKYTICVQSIA